MGKGFCRGPVKKTTRQSRGRFDIRHGKLFDAWAGEYDRFRPTYPDSAINDVVRLSGLTPTSRLLEVGCGTGKATVKFARRGYAIHCVDPGDRLIAYAARNCRSWPRVSFTLGRFEDIMFRPRSYDLVYSAQAFHWVEPRVRLRKAGSILPPGGSLALIYNFPSPPRGPLLRSLASTIEEETCGELSAWSYEDEVARWTEEISRCSLFTGLKVRRHRWLMRYTAEEYIGLFRTFSDFLSLQKPLQRKVAETIRRTIEGHGGFVRRPYECVLIHARRNGKTVRPKKSS